MTRVIAALVFATSLPVLMGPALAEVSEGAREACEKQADEAEPALDPVEREAFIANCLADATADQGKK